MTCGYHEDRGLGNRGNGIVHEWHHRWTQLAQALHLLADIRRDRSRRAGDRADEKVRELARSPAFAEFDLPGETDFGRGRCAETVLRVALDDVLNSVWLPVEQDDHRGQVIFCWVLRACDGLTFEQVANRMRTEVPKPPSGRDWTPDAVELVLWEKGLSTAKSRKSYVERRGEALHAICDAVERALSAFACPLGGDHELTLVTTFPRLIAEMNLIVDEAEEILVCTGSRSRDADYMETIERRLKARPALEHYRLLFGPPWYEALKQHLLNLIKIRDPNPEQPSGRGPKLHIGLFRKFAQEPERFIVANERRALLALPSVTGVDTWDTALVTTEPRRADAWIGWVRQAFAGSMRLETSTAIRALPVLREGSRKDDDWELIRVTSTRRPRKPKG